MRVRGRFVWRGTLVIVAAMGLVACSDSEPSSSSPTTGASADLWAAPDDPMARTVEAGLEPEVKETLIHHVHAHLDVFVDGEPVKIPAGIGIDIGNEFVHKFSEDREVSYGGIQGCDQPCISPLHTHDVTGVLHTESATDDDNTLGQFFTEWGQRLDEDCVATYCRPDEDIAVYVDGELYDGNPADIALTDRREIAIVIGTPPDDIPSTGDFSRA
jgi:hypothetical protein